MSETDWVGAEDEERYLLRTESPLFTELLSVAKIAQPGHYGLLNAYEQRVYELAIDETQATAKEIGLTKGAKFST